MSRAFLTIVLPLLLPTALYLLWAFSVRRAQVGEIGDFLRQLPWLRLSAAGVVLLVGVLTLVALRFGQSADSAHYVPPRTVDGKIVPGHIDPGPPPKF